MTRDIRPQQRYHHFKGNDYQVLTLATHSETGETLVIYQALYGDYRIYARPLESFAEKLDRLKYPDAKQEYRFELLFDANSAIDNTPGDKAEAANEKTQASSADDDTVEQHSIELASDCQMEEEPSLDPLVLAFLDADSYERRLEILDALHHRITDEMINTMAVAVDVEVREGDIEERYEELRKCLLLYDKFECNRLR